MSQRLTRELEKREQETQQETTQRLVEPRERIKRIDETGDERTRRLNEQRDTRQQNARLTQTNLSADVGEMTNVCPHC